MAWLQLTIDPRSADVQVLETALGEVGALAITLTDAGDQPLLEPGVGETPLWSDVRISALFAPDIDVDAVESVLDTQGAQAAGWQELADRQWERAWLERFAPQRFGKSLWIVPGDAAPPDPYATIVRLDPGLAFGTGDHATTAMCLEWIGDHDLRDQRVLDYGCGSGVLAIAALKAGAVNAVALDVDPQALAATRANADRNGIGAELDVAVPGERDDGLFDSVFANILAGPLVKLAERLVTSLAPGGVLVLSGILAAQADEVESAYAAFVDWSPRAARDGWVRLAGTSKEGR